MQPWAKRIKEKLDAGKQRGLSQVGLAKACGKSQPSINQWFNDTDSKPATSMIMADNLMAAAKYLNVSPEWIMTGKDVRSEHPKSQPERLDADIIRAAIILAKKSFKLAHDEDLVIERDPEAFSQALRTAIAMRERKEAEGESGSGDGKAGAVGGPSGQAEDGEAARPAPRRERKRA